nr:nuclear poly(A) polymerase 4-like isoform X1 [Tanacetum cinerariifolium]
MFLQLLVDAGLYESVEESVTHEDVLAQIKQIVVDWVKQLTRQRGYTDQMVEEANAVIFTFGSYRLGVHAPGTGIDTLCVGPSIEDFFFVLHDILKAMKEITELQSIPDAHIPVMKFKFDGISIDLLYANVSLLLVPDDIDIFDSSVLYNVDEPTVRSLNSCRVADQILKHVPNIEVTGYLGGISWALLVARVCQLFPNAIPNMPVLRFFRVYMQWRWPNPVMLCAIQHEELGLAVWDPRKNPEDKTHHMPIITPAYPCMNSSYNVSISTLQVMKEQFLFGNRICEEIERNSAQWPALFEPCMFFESYKNYLQVDLIAENGDDLREWKGWVESRLSQLTLMCHLYPNQFSDPSKHCSHNAYFIGLQRKQGEVMQQGQQFDIRGTIDEFRYSVNMYKHIPAYAFPDGHKRTICNIS